MKLTHCLAAIGLSLSLIGCASPSRKSQPSIPPPTLAARAAAGYEFTNGWHVVQLRGTPDQIGYRHGLALAPQIDEFIAATKADIVHDHGKEHDWAFFREAAERICWPKVPSDLQTEIKAIARGVQDAGYHYDWLDILTLNASIELPDYWLPVHEAHAGVIVSSAPEACSAFIATGSATAGHNIVMGHNFWWGYLTGQHFNVMYCIAPEHGRPFIMDSAPGLIHSGTDVAVSASGLMLCETTISGFVGYDETGIPEFVRMRKAIQEATTIDEMISIFTTGNNGGYANTWLIGDSKTGEIAKLELALHHTPVTRTKDGAFYGANFPEDPGVMEECPGTDTTRWPRRDRWKQLLKEHDGQITAAKGQEFLADTINPRTGVKGATGNTLCGRSDLDPKRGYNPGGAVSNCIVTSEMTKTPSMLAKWGFADGSMLSAEGYLKGRGKQHSWMRGMLHDIMPQPWTSIEVTRPEL